MADDMQQEADGEDQQGGGDGDEPARDSIGKGAVAYLGMRALLAMGRASEAQAELLAMAAAPDAPLALCMSAITARRS